MKIVIKISEEDYNLMKARVCKSSSDYLILDGTPLPKHHGRLIDADAIALIDEQFYISSDYYVAESAIDNAPTIIEGSENK